MSLPNIGVFLNQVLLNDWANLQEEKSVKLLVIPPQVEASSQEFYDFTPKFSIHGVTIAGVLSDGRPAILAHMHGNTGILYSIPAGDPLSEGFVSADIDRISADIVAFRALSLNRRRGNPDSAAEDLHLLRDLVPFGVTSLVGVEDPPPPPASDSVPGPGHLSFLGGGLQ